MKIRCIITLFILMCTLTSAYSQKSVRDSLKEFTISIVQKAMERGNIKKLAVWDFTDMSKEVSSFGSYISEQFSVYAESVDSIQLMDRQNLKSVLREHKLKSEGFIDQNTIMQLGRFKEVEAVAVGSVIMADKDFQVVVKVIETNYGRTIAAGEQFFQIDKRMSAILGIEFTENSNSKPSNNTSNRGYNRPLNSNEQYNNASTVSKECDKKNTGDYCFYNNSRKNIVLFLCDPEGGCGPSNFGATVMVLKPSESKCAYDLSASSVYEFQIYEEPADGYSQQTRLYLRTIIDQGRIKIEQCKSKTYSYR